MIRFWETIADREKEKVDRSKMLYLHIECVIIGMCLDQPVHAPANHLIQIYGLIGKLIAFEKLQSSPAGF